MGLYILFTVTRYGKGVYFARDAVYSARDGYSRPDAQGQKYIFYARVLTGVFTTGDEKMLVPPPRDPKVPEVLFDSTVNKFSNPEIFVTYSDSHAYPDYLITFH